MGNKIGIADDECGMSDEIGVADDECGMSDEIGVDDDDDSGWKSWPPPLPSSVSKKQSNRK